MFTWKSHARLKFHFGQNDWYEIHTVLSFISPQFMWTQLKSWLNTKVRFSTEIKSHIGVSSFRLSCERTLMRNDRFFVFFAVWVLFLTFLGRLRIYYLFIYLFIYLVPFPPGLGRLKSVLYFLQFLASLSRGLN